MSFSPLSETAPAPLVTAQPQAATLVASVAAPLATQGQNPLALEPLYRDIIQKAEALGQRVEAKTPAPQLVGAIKALAAADMKGHLDLKARGTDGDLKCILRGLAEDLPGKLEDYRTAKDPAQKDMARIALAAVLKDNIEVITTPPVVQSGVPGKF